MLSLRPLVAISSASSCLYLWHNPLLAFARYQWLGTPPIWLTSAVVALSVVLGFASLHLIERPVRERRMLSSRKALAAFCVGGLALCLGIGAAGAFGKLEPESAARRDALLAYPAALPQPVQLMPAAGAAVPTSCSVTAMPTNTSMRWQRARVKARC